LWWRPFGISYRFTNCEHARFCRFNKSGQNKPRHSLLLLLDRYVDDVYTHKRSWQSFSWLSRSWLSVCVGNRSRCSEPWRRTTYTGTAEPRGIHSDHKKKRR
jgi:hypothetical protein